MPKIVRELKAITGVLRSKRKALQNLQEATNLFVAEMKKTVGKQGSPETPSRPGQPPRRQTGRLQAEIHGTVDSRTLISEVVSPTFYASFLERGTSRMRPRPYQSATYRRIKPQIDRIMKKRIF